MSRMMKKAESSKWARNVVAVVTALSLVFMQTPVTWAVADQNANSARSVATNLEEEIAQVGATEVGVSFDHAYIVYNDQVVAEPATKMVVPENAELAFQVEPDNGYEVSSVRLMAGGAEQELAADANGVYRIAADKLTADALISVAATVADSAAGPAVVVEQASENVVTEDIELTYSDDDITVVATVPGDDALLAAAQLVVKPITPDTKGYNYDAYMQALNESDEVETATQSNTLLYDIAFMVDGVEVQPAEGAVKIDIQFKNNQLSEGLGAEGGDVTIVHLPLTDAAKSTANTTAEATGISAGDVQVEPLAADTTVEGGEQSAEFVASSFSAYAFVVDKVENGTEVDAGKATVFFTDTTGASTSGPQGNFFVLMSLKHQGNEYHALSQRLDTSKTTVIDLANQEFQNEYNSGQLPNVKYSEGDTLDVFVVQNVNSADAPQNWQRVNLAAGQTAEGVKRFNDGDKIDNRYQVSISVPGAPAAAVETTGQLSAQADNQPGAAPTDPNYDGAFDADTSNDVTTQPNPLVPYSVSVTTYNAEGNQAQPTPAMTDQFYVLATLTDKTTKNVRGWALQPIDINNSNVVSNVEFTEFHKAQPGFSTEAQTIYYDKNVYDIDIRVYHSSNHGLSNFLDFKGKNKSASYTVPGYEFNKTDSDNNSAITMTQKADSPFVVELNFDKEGVQISKDQNYYLYILVKHQTTGDTVGFAPIETNGGLTEQIAITNWFKAGTNELRADEKFTGSEVSVTPMIVKYDGDGGCFTTVNGERICQPGLVTQNSHCAKIEEGGKLAGLKVHFENMAKSDDGSTFTTTDGAFVQKIELTSPSSSADYNYQSILAGGVLYGITANEFDQQNHIQSNFATNYYTGNDKPVEPDLGSAAGAFVIADSSVNKKGDGSTYQIFMGDSHSGNILVYATDKTTQVLKDPRNFVSTEIRTKEELSSTMVEPIIKHADDISAELAKHEASVEPYFFSTGKALIDATALPEDATVYVDADAIASQISTSGNLAIRKHPNQVIVFNFKNTQSVTLSQYYVQYPDMSSVPANIQQDLGGFSGKWLQTWSPTNRDAPQNQAMEMLAKHIVWNGASLKTADIKIGCGIYLFPDDQSKVDISGTSCGWIVSDGYVKNTGGEWHSVYADLPDIDTATLMASKTIDGKRPTVEQRFVFKFERYNPQDGTWSPVDGNAEVENEGGTVSKTVSGLSDGWNIFRITETHKAAGTEGSYNIDSKTIYAAVKYIDAGSYHYATNPVYYSSFAAPETFDANADSVPGLSGAVASPTFANTKSTERQANGSIEIEASKELTGDTLAAGQFTFELKDAQGNVLKTATNDANGNVKFEALSYTLPDAGQTYTYTISERTTPAIDGVTYDTHEEAVTVQVADNGTENLDVTAAYDESGAKFENAYSAKGSVQIKAHKELTGDTLKADQFTFVLKDAQGNELKRATNDANGNVSFGTIEYTAGQLSFDYVDDQGRRYAEITYTIAEVLPATSAAVIAGDMAIVNGMLYDNTAKTVTVRMTDLGNGTLEATYYGPNFDTAPFANKLEKVSIGGTKVWSDADNQDGIRPNKVTVRLVANDVATDNTVEVSAATNWNFTFADLPKYDDEGKEIRYSVAEDNVTGYSAAVTGSMGEGFTITNNHKPETTSINAEKTWVDDNNKANKRPTSVTFQLKADGENYLAAKTVTADDNGEWKTSWTELPKYKNGREIVYTVVEINQPEDYAAAVTGDAEHGFVVTNTLKPGETSVSVSKVWEDSDNHDKIRPESISVQLKADGKNQGAAVTLPGEDGNWAYAWTGLPKYKDGKEIVYTIAEVDVPEGYTSAITGDASKGFVITNTHLNKKTSVSVSKEWDDADNHDGLRPSDVSIQLMNGNKTVGKPIVLNDSNHWTHTWSGLDALDDNGQEITYSVSEAAVNGYTPEIKLVSQSDTEFVYSVTNKHDVGKVNAQVTKIWNDDNNRDGIRPESVEVKLVRTDGVAVENSEKTLEASNNWTASWTDLDKLSGGKEIEYKVEETAVPAGYAVSYGEMTKIDNNTYGFTVTNTHEVEKTSVNVVKAWVDDNNRDGLRADSVTVKLQADGVDVANSTVTLDGSNSWAHTWTGLTKYRDGGKLIEYTVVEENVPTGYTVSYSGDAANGITVTNTHHETTKASVEKVWSDSDNRDGKRPSSVTVQLYADGAAYGDPVVLQDGAWTHEWTDLPVHKNDAGDIKDIEYTLEETETGGYTPSVKLNRGQDNSWNFTVTNTYTAEETTMTVVKEWDDDSNRDGKRPAEIQVRLLADGEQYGDVVTLKDGAWSHTWTKLPKNKDGQKITYSVEELNKDDFEALGYTSTVTPGETSYKIVNSRDTDKTSVSVRKKWEDDNNREGVQPQKVTVELLANGTVKESVELEGDAWSYTWNNLPVNENGAKITYSVREVVPDGYQLVSIVEDPDYSFTITNKHDIKTVGVSATKVWNDDDNRDVVRPVSVDVNLKADGKVIDTKTLNAENGWTYNWTEQPKFSAKDAAIVYTVEEAAVPEGYEATYASSTDESGNFTFTVTNKHEVAKTGASVDKVWADNHNADNVRPQSITVQLYADGVAYDKPVTLAGESAADDSWSYAWSDLPKYRKDGTKNEIVYTVGEVGPIGDGYQSAKPVRMEGNHFVVVNSREWAKTTVQVTKDWQDRDDADTVRPASVSVQLYADEVAVGSPVELNAENNWSYAWSGLDKNKRGDNGSAAIDYTVKEVATPGDYAVSYNVARGTDGSFSWTVTNKRTTEKTSASVHKTWSDDNNRDRVRPDSVTVQLKADGVAEGEPVVLDASNDWSYEWPVLEKNRNVNGTKTPIIYSVEETAPGQDYVPSVEVTHGDDGSFAFEVTNTRTPEKTGVTVTKDWRDDDNRDGKRPTSVSVQLLANGVAQGNPVKLDVDNSWSYSWTNLDKFAGGTPINYTVEELNTDALKGIGYEANIVKNEGDGFSYTVENSRETEKTDVTVGKSWEDDNNQDGYRPDHVTLKLYADGKYVKTQDVVAGEDGSWSYTFTGLDKYRDGGVEIAYTVAEDVTAVPAKYSFSTSEDGLTAINTHNKELVDIAGQKVWVDGNNQDSTRPDEITVVLKDGEKEVARQTTTADKNWAYEFKNLDKNRNGQPIQYTVEELEVPGYTTAVDGNNITNTLKVGQLEVTKSVVGPTTSKAFHFTVTLSDTKVNGVHGDMTFANGVAEFTLKAGETKTAKDLPAGVTYEVVETEEAGYTPTATNATGTIAEGQKATAAFTNTYKAVGQAQLGAKKNLIAETGKKTLETDDYSFQLVEGDTVLQTVGNVGTSVTFAPIKYEYTSGDPIVHTYKIREVVPGENAAPNGITYDQTVYTVTVTATDKGDGTLNVTYDYGEGFNAEQGVLFTNTYRAEGKAELQVHKDLVGMSLSANQFTFVLEGDGITEPVKVKNGADGNAKFDLTYSQPGTYHYTIKEEHPEHAQPKGDDWLYNGITYSGKTVNVTVEVTDNGNGTMTATPTYSVGNENVARAEFTNTYEPKGTYALVASKEMAGRSFQEGDRFTFAVTGTDVTKFDEGEAAAVDAPMPENPSVTIEPTSGTSETIGFGLIRFKPEHVGHTFEYTITETENTTKGGVTSSLPHVVRVTVSDDLKGNLVATPVYPNETDAANGGIVLTNTYTAEGEAQLFATKTLTGRNLKDKEFYFELKDEGGNVLERVAASLDEGSTSTGTATFTPIPFTLNDAGKDFNYKIVEVTENGLGGVAYDTHEEKVTIHVADNGDGTLKVTYDGGATYAGAKFANTYDAEDAKVKLEATKLLAGGTPENGQFSFTLTNADGNAVATNQTKSNDASGKVTFDELTFSNPGTYEYRIVENRPNDAVDMGNGLYRKNTIVYDGTVHTAKVIVADDENGKLEAKVVYDESEEAQNESLTITNGIYLSRTSFEFDKYFFGGSGDFKFLLTATDAQGNARGNNPHAYVVDQASIVDGVFNQEIKDNGTDAFTITVSNGAFANGRAKVAFPEIQFAADGDYYYVVSENKVENAAITTDEASYLIHVTVSGGEVTGTTYNLLYKGKDYGTTTDLSFYNNSTVKLGFASISAQSYTGLAQKTSVYPEVKKYLNGKTDNLVAGEFAFQLVDEKTGQPIATATNDETGNVAFFDEQREDGLVFTEAGTYRYIIREVEGDQPNIIYDKSEIVLTVTVTETIEGLKAEMSYGGAVGAGEEPAFYNNAEGMDLKVRKVSRYGGEGLDKCTYALWMVGDNGDVMIQEATSDSSGYILFENVNLMKGVKYYFKEVEAPAGHTVDPYRTAYFSLTEDGTNVVLVEDTAADGWHSKYDNIELDKARKASEGSE